MTELIKYPRTWHIEGSRLQPGDEDLAQIPFASVSGEKLVVEEKCDGANSAVSFSEKGDLLLQSRGHFLTGGYREKHFNLLKQWANIHQNSFFDILGSQYIMYGEWLYAKHTIFYDSLPHYFLEFDIYDREKRRFLDTPTRHTMLAGLPVVSAPVLKNSIFTKLDDLTDLIGQSNFISGGHMEKLRAYCTKAGEDVDKRCGETDPSTLMEGLYIKIERNGEVVERMKYIRNAFLQCVFQSDSHWLSRPIIPNQLRCPFESIFMDKLPDQARTICHE